MADAKDMLKQKLLSSESARAQFMTSVKDLLHKQGIPTDDETLKQLGFSDLDVKDPQSFVSAMSTVIVTLVM